MKKFKSLPIVLGCILLIALISTRGMAQNEYLTLTFSGDNNGQNISLDSIYIKNLTQGTDTVIYDTTFIIGPNRYEIYTFFTEFKILSGYDETIRISVFNELGQMLLQSRYGIVEGLNTFGFYPGREKIYFLTAESDVNSSTIKVVSTSTKKGDCKLIYEGSQAYSIDYKSEIYVDFPLVLGDELLLVGYSELGESVFTDIPQGNTDYIFQFATNIPCPGLDSLYYEGQWYHTIQVYSQCWFKENLNAGTWIQASQPQTNNGVIEKYCMEDMALGCELFGGLYFRFEMMNYVYESGGQGICPEGWHVPLDMDWKILEASVDSLYTIADPIWNNSGWRGSDAGGNLKQTGYELWEPPNTGATDAYGFNLLPAGYFVQNEFWGPGYKTYLWTSDYPTSYFRNVDWDKATINRESLSGSAAISVRCIKNLDFNK